MLTLHHSWSESFQKHPFYCLASSVGVLALQRSIASGFFHGIHGSHSLRFLGLSGKCFYPVSHFSGLVCMVIQHFCYWVCGGCLEHQGFYGKGSQISLRRGRRRKGNLIVASQCLLHDHIVMTASSHNALPLRCFITCHS